MINIKSKYSEISKFLSNKLPTKPLEATVDISLNDYFECTKNKIKDIFSTMPNFWDIVAEIDDAPLLSLLVGSVLFIIKMLSH